MDREKWFVPSYYPDFRCKADRCRSTCCSNWQIPVSHKEYNRLVTMERTEDLDRRIQSAFVVPKNASEERYRLISFNWLGFCPIQEKALSVSCVLSASAIVQQIVKRKI